MASALICTRPQPDAKRRGYVGIFPGPHQESLDQPPLSPYGIVWSRTVDDFDHDTMRRLAAIVFYGPIGWVQLIGLMDGRYAWDPDDHEGMPEIIVETVSWLQTKYKPGLRTGTADQGCWQAHAREMVKRIEREHQEEQGR